MKTKGANGVGRINIEFEVANNDDLIRAKHGDLPPGHGVVDFAPYLREIKALGIDGAVSIELEYSPQPEKIAEWVKEAYTQTDRLMRDAELRG